MNNRGTRTATLLAVVVLVLLGIFPLSAIGKSAQAEYPPEYVGEAGTCYNEAEYVAVFLASTQAYADAGLSIPVLTIPGGTAGKSLQKYLVCSSDFEADYITVVVATTIVYVPNPGIFLPRNARDS